MPSLTFKRVEAIKEPGRHSDGGGLFLLVGPNGAKSWVCRVQHDGRRREFGLGGYPAVSLAEAREAAAAIRSMVKAGGDPLADKREKARLETLPNFTKAAAIRHGELASMWRNPKHRAQWLYVAGNLCPPDDRPHPG